MVTSDRESAVGGERGGVDPGPRRRLWSVLFLVTSLACADSGAGGCEGISGCAGGAGCVDLGCGLGCEPTAYDPDGEVIAHAVQVRLTPEALDFLEGELEPLVADLLGGGDAISMCVPRGSLAPFVSYCYAAPIATCEDTSECPPDTTCQLGNCYYSSCGVEGDEVVTGCTVDVGISGVSLEPVAVEDGPDRLDVSVLLDLDEYIPIGSCPALHVVGEGVPVSASVVFHVDDAAEGDVAVPGTSDRVWFDIEDIAFDLSGLTLSVPEELGPFGDPGICGDPEDAIALIEDLLDDAAGPALRAAVEGFVCAPCGDGGECGPGASCGEEPAVCRYDDTDACVPAWLGAEGAIDLAGLLGGVGSRASHPLSFLFYLAGYADAEAGGLSLGVEVGLYAGSDACVPVAPMPSTEAVARSVELVSGRDDKDDAFMLGVGIDHGVFDLGLWALQQSGALCLALDSATSLGGSSPPLTTGLVGLLFGVGDSLNALTRVSQAPDISDAALLFAVRPQEPPTVTLGRGAVEGTTVTAPSLVLHMPRLYLDMYAWVDGRYVRIFTLDVDLALPLALVPSEDGGAIRILRGELDDVFTRAEVIDAELLTAEEIEGIPAALPALVSILEGALPAELTDPIELPEVSGLRLRLGEAGISTFEGDSMLAIVADLEGAAAPEALGVVAAPELRASVREVRLPDAATLDAAAEARAAGGVVDLDALRPRVVVDVETVDRSGAREHSYRLNGGLWRQFRAGEPLVIDDPALLIEGTHHIEVQSRDAASGGDLSRISSPLAVTVDLSLPDVWVALGEDGSATVSARDRLWGEDVALAWRALGGGGSERWQTVADGGFIDAAELVGARAVEVEATDPAGRSRLVTRELAIHGRTTDTSGGGDDGCGGCSASGPGRGARSVDASWLLGLAAIGSLGRRRRQRVPRARALLLGAVVVCAALLVAGCADRRRSPVVVDPEDAEDVGDAGTADTDLGGAEEEPDAAADDVDEEVDAADVSACSDGAACEGLACGDDQRGDCVEGACVCVEACAGGCDRGEVCCVTSGACEDGPGDCSEQVCGPREVGAVVTEGAWDPVACEASEPECGCVPAPRDVGAFLSAGATTDGDLVVAAYDWSHGDLLVGRAEVPAGDAMVDLDVAWEVVDGLPVERLDPDVGRWADLEVGTDGVVHVAYYDRSARAPRYARGVPEGAGGGWSWTTMVVETEAPGGLYADLSLSSAGVPAIAYFAPSVPVGEDGRATELRVARADGAVPAAWTVEVVTARPRSAETPSYATLPEGDGLFPALTWLEGGELLLVWYDADQGNLMYAQSVEGSFAGSVAEVLDGQVEIEGGGGTEDTGDVGQFVAMSAGVGDVVHLVYVDATRDRLLHRTGGAEGFGGAEIVDDGLRGEPEVSEHVLVGDDASLVLLEDGTPQVVYMDATHHVAVVSQRPEIGWTQATTVLEEAGAIHGLYLDQVVLPGVGTVVIGYRHAREVAGRGVVGVVLR
jgi:hypothetical protein